MRIQKAFAAAAAALALGMSSMAWAQETTGAVHGLVTGDGGKPLAGATVVVTHVPSGTSVTTTTNGDGAYDAQNLRTGGPYTVTATSSVGAKTLRIDDIEAGPAYNLNINVGAAVSEIIVTGTAARAAQVQTGPRTIITSRDIQTLPSFTRDLRDLVRLSPFVTLDPTNSNAMIIAGANNRFNTVYVDGVKQADDFGLNANGYPTQRSPIALSVIQSSDLEIAPEDVQYGSFQGGILNIVTKSGTNAIHGSGYVEYDDNHMAGASVQGRPIARFRDVTYGATLGGPIWRDRLFVYGGYEHYKGFGANSPIYGPTGSSAPNLVTGVTQADVDNVRNIMKTVYNFDPLNWSDVGGEQTDTKWFGKVDFNINENHRAVFEYQRTDGTTTFNGAGSGTSDSTSTTAPVLELGSHWYNLDQILTAYTGELFSHWTNSFSTDVFYTHKAVDQIRAPLAGNSFAEFDVTLPDGAKIIAGPDISSQGNVLQNTDQLFKFRAHYTMGDHVFTAGYEREWLDVFNEFVQNGNGQYVFNGTCGSGNGLTNLQNKVACQLTYANAPDNIKADAAASWSDITNAFYVQDEWRPAPGVTVHFGVRDELYDQPGKPAFNPRFLAQYGFSNTATLNGKNVLMPRFGFNWTPDPTVIVTGGVGLYSGGTPNVWISNDYSNTGNLIGAVTCRPTGPCATSLLNVDGFNVGADAKAANTATAVTNNGIVNALDPHFRPPSTWKATLHAQKTFDIPWVGGMSNPWIGSDWNVHGDFIYQKVKDAISYVDLLAASAPLSAAPDGRPRFSPTRFTAVRSTGYDLLLTDTHQGGGEVWSVGLGKDWHSGWLDGATFDFSYTGENIRDVNPGTSSVAASNYGTFAVSDPNHPALAISNYNIKWEFKLTAGYRRAFFGDYFTDVRLYAQRRAGLPFSYTFQSSASSGTAADQMFGESGVFASRSRQLLYVPKADSTGAVTATSDPIVTYGSSFNVAAFNQFLQQSGLIKYAGQITPRNAFTSRPQTTADLRISQEIPAFFPHGSKGRFYLDIIDLPNLLNSNWGQVQQISFPYFYSLISASNCQNPGSACLHGIGNFYQYNAQNTRTPSTTDRFSVWQMKVGFEYDF